MRATPGARRVLYACGPMSPKSPALILSCQSCGGEVPILRAGQPAACSACGASLGKVTQLDQLLARWYEPRRWRADLVRPSVPYLIEKLWTANGQGERLYQGVAPRYTNYDIFRNLVTRLIIKGVDEGWAQLTFPPDPLLEDPQYELRIVDSERFASGVEQLFPEVDWDEAIDVAALGFSEPAPARGKAARKR